MTTLPHEAFVRFHQLLQRAGDAELREPAAMTLATAGSDGCVSARVVLLRAFDERGFVFYTNLNSDKAHQMDANSEVALCFYWDPLAEQVRIQGRARAVTNEEADAYWKARARDSQIGAWASRQSETLEDRGILEQRIAEFEIEFRGRDVPRPEFWSGFRVEPRRVEFWSNRPARLHERIVYELVNGGWTKRQLYP